MIDQQTFERLLPAACEWTKAQEEFVLAHGVPLTSRQFDDARLAGVQDCDRVRVLVVDRIPLPDDLDLAQAARRAGIMTDDTRCVGFGHALIIHVSAWADRELIVHNLVHIAQCERSGGLGPWIRKYLSNRTTCAEFTVGELENEARNLARDICAGHPCA